VAVIFNPQKVDALRLAGIVNGLLRRRKLDPALMLPTDSGNAQAGLVQTAIDAGCTLLLIAGGDGTLRTVLEAVQGTSLSVGLLPRGTGNVLARNLGIPLGSLAKATTRALDGNDRAIDIARVNFTTANGQKQSQLFAVMAGIGLDAKIMMNTDPKLKKQFGWVAYIDGGLRSLPARFETMDVSVNSRPSKRLQLHSLIVGNCGFLPGNINLMPEARLDDGVLDLAAVGPHRFWHWIDFWNRVTWIAFMVGKVRGWRKLAQQTANVKTLENLAGKVIEVWPEHPVDIQLDGDPFGKVHAAAFEVLPKALRVRC
jgi:YegS/Rv2252/BmrU family lipid kinase